MDVLHIIEQNVLTIIKPIVETRGLVLVELKVQRRSQDIYVQLLTDHPNGGITLDECMDLNKDLSHQVEESGLLAEGFFLEVSSPGLDRPLKTKEDFCRVLNREVRIYLSEKVEGKLEHAGTVADVIDKAIVVKNNQGVIDIPIEFINKGFQVIDKA